MAGRDYLPLTAEVLAAHLSGRCTLACIHCWMVTAASGWRRISKAGRLTDCLEPGHYVGRILRPLPGKTSVEITTTATRAGVLAHPVPNVPRLHQPGLPDPYAAATRQVPTDCKDQAVGVVAHAVLAGSQPTRRGAQPLLNHKRQPYGSRTFTALNGNGTLTC
jgi:hypothetical protein